jgi:hypothetical protein
MSGITRSLWPSLRLRAISAPKRMKAPSGRPLARPTVQVLALRILGSSGGGAGAASLSWAVLSADALSADAL